MIATSGSVYDRNMCLQYGSSRAVLTADTWRAARAVCSSIRGAEASFYLSQWSSRRAFPDLMSTLHLSMRLRLTSSRDGHKNWYFPLLLGVSRSADVLPRTCSVKPSSRSTSKLCGGTHYYLALIFTILCFQCCWLSGWSLSSVSSGIGRLTAKAPRPAKQVFCWPMAWYISHQAPLKSVYRVRYWEPRWSRLYIVYLKSCGSRHAADVMGKASCTKKCCGCNTMPMTLSQTLLVEVRRHMLWIVCKRFAKKRISITVAT